MLTCLIIFGLRVNIEPGYIETMLLTTLVIIDILREDLSLSIKSAEHKTQLLVGQKICQQPPESISSWAFWKKDNQQLGM